MAGSRGALVDTTFGALCKESVRCNACGKETHEVPPHFEHTHTYSVASLRMIGMEMRGGQGVPLGRLLREVVGQDMKKCDKEKGGCDQWQVRGGRGRGGGVMGQGPPLGRLLREAVVQDMKECDKGKGGCNQWQVQGGGEVG